MEFYNELGKKPKGKWSVGRINNNVGYTKGNIRWESDEEQARNHSMQSNNTSGHTGISIRLNQPENSDRVVARIGISEKKRISKSFSILENGLGEAVKLAVEWRESKIKELEARGIIYGQFHGVKDNFIGD
jgi:hypothetical protein